MLRFFAVLILVGGLSGCLTLIDGETVWQDGVKTMPTMYCANDDNGPAKTVDWKTATLVEETVKDDRYESGLLTLWQNKPYIIRVTNQDDGVRSFRAPAFFRDVAVLKAVYKDRTVEHPCINALTLAPGASGEIHIIPLKTGSYDYHETGIWLPFLGEIVSASDVGVIYVH